jgi:hypothetical protein
MITIVIPTEDSEAALVATLEALVPAAVAGVISDVVVADASSHDGTAKVADTAGARLLQTPGPLGARLQAAARVARAPWLLFLRPGMVPDPSWTDEASSFVRQAQLTKANVAAVFRHGAGPGRRGALVEAWRLAASALARPRPEQGLLIGARHYEGLGGHPTDHGEPEAELLRRLGRRNILLLRSAVTLAA